MCVFTKNLNPEDSPTINISELVRLPVIMVKFETVQVHFITDVLTSITDTHQGSNKSLYKLVSTTSVYRVRVTVA